MSNKKKKVTPGLIADNRKARHDYEILEKFEAGLALEGWEVKSLREGRAQLRDSYVLVKKGEAWLIGAHISVLNTTCKHTNADPVRSRKLLLSRREPNKLTGAIQQKGLTAVPLNLHWSKGYVKLDMALTRGKKSYDKRETLKERAIQRDQERSRK